MNDEENVNQIIFKKILNNKNKPENLTEKEWSAILKKIAHALDKSSKKTKPVSVGRRKVLAKEIKEGFDLLRVYYSYLD
ncbi:MAG: hypothetical protein EBY39_06480 [Flavobacteriia bacterium]|nr:hypothetical protein [Flavobacteriia bacterium]